MQRLRSLDVVDQLQRVTEPTLVCVGALDPVAPPSAADEIIGALPPAVRRLEVIAGAGHFPWLDAPDHYWPLIKSFITQAPDSLTQDRISAK
jgi:pimeloyl-ACP methyl ester carboxylesterase